jgi:cytochrome c5
LPRHSTFLAAAALALAAPGVEAGDAGRGRALYESQCASCHSQSVHGREKRVARDFEAVRAWVERWNASLALRWGEEEIEDVTVYLNGAYYRFACPPSACKVVSLASPR